MDQRTLIRGEARGDVGLPAYLSISRNIERDIDADVWPRGSCLPNEKTLADRFAVSIGTVRRAVSELVDRGLLIRRQGIGTFVTGSKISAKSEPALPFVLNHHSEYGCAPDVNLSPPPSRLLNLIQSTANSEQARALGVAEGTPVWLIKTSYDFDGQAIAYEINTIACQDYPNLNAAMLEKFNGSIYRVAAEVYSREVKKATDQVSINSPNPEVRDAFGLGQGDTCLRVHRLSMDASNRTIESRELWLDPLLAHYRASSDLS